VLEPWLLDLPSSCASRTDDVFFEGLRWLVTDLRGWWRMVNVLECPETAAVCVSPRCTAHCSAAKRWGIGAAATAAPETYVRHDI
jgi:hypothetical protein